MNPEEKVCLKIDEALTGAGWIIQDRSEFDRTAGVGVAVREFLMADRTEADYLLFVDGKAYGVIEAKKEGCTLSGIENQSGGYSAALPSNIRAWQMPLPFIYEANSSEIRFTDARDIDACSRRIFAFQKPETLLELIQTPETLRNNLKHMPELNKTGLRDCQIEAIEGLEQAFANNKPRSLIHMTTGAGKTFEYDERLYNRKRLYRSRGCSGSSCRQRRNI